MSSSTRPALDRQREKTPRGLLRNSCQLLRAEAPVGCGTRARTKDWTGPETSTRDDGDVTLWCTMQSAEDGAAAVPVIDGAEERGDWTEPVKVPATRPRPRGGRLGQLDFVTCFPQSERAKAPAPASLTLAMAAMRSSWDRAPKGGVAETARSPGGRYRGARPPSETLDT